MRISTLIALLALLALSGSASFPGYAQSAGPTWTRSAATVPDGFASVVYDSARQKSVGVAYNFETKLLETWEYDGTTWARKSTVAASRDIASARNAVYDSKRNRIVMFGLVDINNPDYKQWKYLNETWEYDGNSWSKKNTALSPTFRSDFTMVYDANRARTVMFGGYTNDANFKPQGDTWEYDGTNWFQVILAAAPAPRSGPALAYDSARKIVVLFGGESAGCCPPNIFGDTWEYDGTHWTQRNTISAPPPRTQANLAYDKSRTRSVLFGGGKPNPTLNDTWEYDGTDWIEIKTPVSPGDRSGGGFIFDEARNRIVLAGGSYACVTLEDCMNVKPLYGASAASPNWTVRYFPPSISQRSRFLFGGGGPRNDTWEYGAGSQSATPHLAIMSVELNPKSLYTYQDVTAVISIKNTGALVDENWSYTGYLMVPSSGNPSSYRIDFDTGHKSTLHLAKDSLGTPINPQQWVLTVETGFYGDPVTNGNLQVSVQPQRA